MDTTSKGPSLAKGPAHLLGQILVAFGLVALVNHNGFPSFDANFPDGTPDGGTWLGIGVNGWTAWLCIAAGALLLAGAMFHLAARTMSLVVGLALAAAAIISLVDGDVLGLAYTNGWTELGLGAAAAWLLITALLPRVKHKEHHDVEREGRIHRDHDHDRHAAPAAAAAAGAAAATHHRDRDRDVVPPRRTDDDADRTSAMPAAGHDRGHDEHRTTAMPAAGRDHDRDEHRTTAMPAAGHDRGHDDRDHHVSTPSTGEAVVAPRGEEQATPFTEGTRGSERVREERDVVPPRRDVVGPAADRTDVDVRTGRFGDEDVRRSPRRSGGLVDRLRGR